MEGDSFVAEHERAAVSGDENRRNAFERFKSADRRGQMNRIQCDEQWKLRAYESLSENCHLPMQFDGISKFRHLPRMAIHSVYNGGGWVDARNSVELLLQSRFADFL